MGFQTRDAGQPSRRPVRAVMRGACLASALLAIAALASCARPEVPMGGPPDPNPPQLVRVTPATGTTAERPSEVVFQFDEVVSEQPAGARSLSELVLISPRDGDVRVRWRRSAISVRPRTGWRDATTYTVTLRPGVADLRGNASDSVFTTVFSTGGPILETSITGVVFDWAAGAPMPGALVMGISRPVAVEPDSAVYITIADSSGRFVLPHVPPGPVTIIGLQDGNLNYALDSREPFDSLALSLRDSMDLELYAFVHDSTPPLPRTVAVLDSVTLAITMSQPLLPSDTITPANITIVGADSMPVAIRIATTRALFDSLQAAAAPPDVPADTVPVPPEEALPDTIPELPQDSLRPVPSRPIPPSEIVVVLEQPLPPEANYEVRTTGLRNLLGIVGDGAIRITTRPAEVPPEDPELPPPDSSAASLRPRR